MRTEDLIIAMAADNLSSPSIGTLIMRRFLPSIALVVLAVLVVLGPRSDLAVALTAPVTAMKYLLPLALALFAGMAVFCRARPEQRAGRLIWPIALICALAAIWLAATMAKMPATDWWPTARGQSWRFCLIAIPLIALIPLAGLIAALRKGASTAPMRSGALAGLTAGAAAAAIYALHCTEDSPLFFLCWYGLGILVVTVIGALAGRRWLRW
ncbi:DUF1109 family protein [Paracoccus sp. 11-3]|uniref:DUF1109 family protein n=1 Tax=Paracoccus amoyensis TaxID=2760093 RepID=A0A926J651_9RHOB|nr:NrsF family protein [Paracoccus amoyensis]MBC9246907.1 DUF1109 family protein [Paracoccus amoyensis]